MAHARRNHLRSTRSSRGRIAKAAAYGKSADGWAMLSKTRLRMLRARRKSTPRGSSKSTKSTNSTLLGSRQTPMLQKDVDVASITMSEFLRMVKFLIVVILAGFALVGPAGAGID